jgi:hypothetical protein
VDAAQQKASCNSTVVVAAPAQPAPPPQPAPAPAPQPAPAPTPTAPEAGAAPAPAPKPAPAPAPQPAPKPTPPGRDGRDDRDDRDDRDSNPTSPAPTPQPAPAPTSPAPEPGVAPEPSWPAPDPGLAPEAPPTLPAGLVTLVCPTIAPVKEDGQSGKAAVEFADPVFSDGTLPVTVSCTPRSGSQFRIGTTTVACSATNTARELFSCTTTVTVTNRPKLSNGGGS